MNLKPARFQYESKTGTGLLIGEATREKSRYSDYWELTKPRLSMLSVITAIVGYLAALPVREPGVLASLIIGTSLAAGGAAALNQWAERVADAKMVRTRGRPIPAGLVTPEAALIFGLFLCLAGDLLLVAGVNILAASLALATQAAYLLAYTPLKKHTPWCIEVGAIPGALPPLIGWAAAESGISTLGWILFAILLFWQIPHFMALAWTYRKDYARAGFPMGSVTDPSGNGIARQSFIFTILLFGCSLLPALLGFTTIFYTSLAIVTGLWFLYAATRFLFTQDRDRAARKLFLASIAYLPILLGGLVLDRLLLY